ncbi:hypothetical protein [Mesorhizobium sp. NZP2298]|uniref:hypothetical protein n=1 Tax=Mesorhizobium sp. NZP2298 TaxID=2483403 RepID=UPI001555CEB8|nr:hypothetical protein [Mesorhizobium sp. NZP2298]
MAGSAGSDPFDSQRYALPTADAHGDERKPALFRADIPGGASWRKRLLDDIGDQGPVSELIESRSDAVLAVHTHDAGHSRHENGGIFGGVWVGSNHSHSIVQTAYNPLKLLSNILQHSKSSDIEAVKKLRF